MTCRVFIFAFAGMVATGVPTLNAADCRPARFGPSPVTLEWIFQKGKPIYLEETTVTTQTMVIMGSTIKNTQTQTFMSSWTLKNRDKNGNWILRHKIESVKMNFEVSGLKLTYDSTKKKHSLLKDSLDEFLETLVESELEVTLDKNYKVTKVKGGDEILDKLGDPHHKLRPIFKEALSECSSDYGFNPTFAAIPRKAIRAGDIWKSDHRALNMGPIGKYDLDYEYAYQGKTAQRLDKIHVLATLKYDPPAAVEEGLPFKIIGADFEPAKSTGTILFDNQKGRVVSSETTMDIKGTLLIEIAGMEVLVELKQRQKTTLKDVTPSFPEEVESDGYSVESRRGGFGLGHRRWLRGCRGR